MANAVTGPTPGCVVNRTASGRCFTSSSTRRFSSTISASNPSSACSNFLRRSAAYGSKGNCSSSARPASGPQLVLLLHAVAQRHGLQLILGARPRLHLLVPMHQQLPHIPHLQARHPDPRKPVFDEQMHQMLRVPPIRLLLAHHRGPHLRRISKPQLEPQLLKQPLEPRIVPARLHPHPHFLPRQRPIKLLRFRPVLQPFFLYFSRSVVKDRDLLKPRMKITAYNQHDVGPSHEPWPCLSQPNLLAVTGQRLYAIKQSSAPRLRGGLRSRRTPTHPTLPAKYQGILPLNNRGLVECPEDWFV